MVKLKRVALSILAGVCFVGGLAVAGSEGPAFPWANVLGVAVLALVVPLSWWIERIGGVEDGDDQDQLFINHERMVA